MRDTYPQLRQMLEQVKYSSGKKELLVMFSSGISPLKHSLKAWKESRGEGKMGAGIKRKVPTFQFFIKIINESTCRALKMTLAERGERVVLLSSCCSRLRKRPLKSVGGLYVLVPRYWTELKASGNRPNFLKRS